MVLVKFSLGCNNGPSTAQIILVFNADETFFRSQFTFQINKAFPFVSTPIRGKSYMNEFDDQGLVNDKFFVKLKNLFDFRKKTIGRLLHYSHEGWAYGIIQLWTLDRESHQIS